MVKGRENSLQKNSVFGRDGGLGIIEGMLNVMSYLQGIFLKHLLQNSETL